jgi:hypothetical protein|tara:strand:- start:910 stop:1041 length:132 start_codon:yes stop_codon:yes gene_type:complete
MIVIIVKKARYAPGICFEKKDNTKNNDDKNQKIFLFLIKAKIR